MAETLSFLTMVLYFGGTLLFLAFLLHRSEVLVKVSVITYKSFACRFAGMAGALKDAKGEPTKLKMALKKWGFGSKEAARNFCNKHKSKK